MSTWLHRYSHQLRARKAPFLTLITCLAARMIALLLPGTSLKTLVAVVACLVVICDQIGMTIAFTLVSTFKPGIAH